MIEMANVELQVGGRADSSGSGASTIKSGPFAMAFVGRGRSNGGALQCQALQSKRWVSPEGLGKGVRCFLGFAGKEEMETLV